MSSGLWSKVVPLMFNPMGLITSLRIFVSLLALWSSGFGVVPCETCLNPCIIDSCKAGKVRDTESTCKSNGQSCLFRAASASVSVRVLFVSSSSFYLPAISGSSIVSRAFSCWRCAPPPRIKFLISLCYQIQLTVLEIFTSSQRDLQSCHRKRQANDSTRQGTMHMHRLQQLKR